MNGLKIIVFDVGRGFCAFLKTPNRFSILIDCGRKKKFSPVRHIFENELVDCRKYFRRPLTFFISTHPHGDHLDDFRNLTFEACQPAVVRRQRGYDFRRVCESNTKVGWIVTAAFELFMKRHSVLERRTLPTWGGGMTITRLFLTPRQSAKISGSDSAYVNNSSMVVIVKYRNHKIMFSGDLLTEGWSELLRRPRFRAAIRRTTTLVTPHHGHKSGFCGSLYKYLGRGRPLFHVVSERSERENEGLVYGAYSLETYSGGIPFKGKTRRMFSTRDSGSVIIEILPNGKWRLDEEKFPDNEQ